MFNESLESRRLMSVAPLAAAVMQSAPVISESLVHVGSVTRFELLDAVSHKDLGRLTPGRVIIESPGQQFAVRAFTTGAIGSIRFQLDRSYAHTENYVGYDLFGTAANGTSEGRVLTLGSHTLTARPYTAHYLGGAAGSTTQVQFTVKAPVLAPAPKPTPKPPAPTPAPTPTPPPAPAPTPKPSPNPPPVVTPPGVRTPPPPAGNASGPFTINAGGTYTGNWSSNNPGTPAVTIATTAPVTIINSRINGGIATSVNGAQVTITHNIGTGGGIRFADIESFKTAVITHNEIDGTEGIYLRGDGFTPTQVVIDNNAFHNITGDPNQLTQAVQFDKVQLGGAEIAWNQVVNDPGASSVEDVISIYQSSGTAGNPIKIHDNYIQGAYPANPKDATYSGGGIMLSDSGSSYVQASNNQVLDTTNYGIAISGGHDNSISQNRVLGLTARPAGNVGIYIWNSNGGKFFNNTATANAINFVQADGSRNDAWTPDASAYTGNTSLSSSDAAEWTFWQAKLNAESQSVGN